MSLELNDLARDAVAAAPTRLPDLIGIRRRVDRRRRKRRIVVGVACVPLVILGAAGAWNALNLDDAPAQVIAAGGSEITAEPGAEQPAVSPGEFVWPAPPQDFNTWGELTNAFVGEVLGWPSDQVRLDGGTDETGPQSLTLVHLEDDSELHLLAIPSTNGWGFVQIGDGNISLSETLTGGLAVRFRPPGTAASNTVEIRYSDGEITSTITADAELALPAGRAIDSVVSVLITHRAADDDVLSVSGGQFGTTEPEDPSLSGDAAIIMPELTRLHVGEAAARLDAIGVAANIVETSDPSAGPGTVLSTDPPAGSMVNPGTTIILTIAAEGS